MSSEKNVKKITAVFAALALLLLILIVIGGATARYPVDSTQDVKSFGAKGNGKDDDTAAIQAAIDSLKPLGGTVFFPAGVYKTSASLIVPQYVNLKGAGMIASTISFGGPGYAIQFGSASSASLVYGNGASDLRILLTNASSNGITLQATCGAVLSNLHLEGVIPNTSTAIFVDGGSIANQFTGLTNINANHFKCGYRLGTTGNGPVTSLVATNINSFGDTLYKVKGSVGLQIDENQGQGSRFYGGNMESCTNGIYGKGTFVMINGMRFEDNDVDIVLEKPASAWFITGCMGLDRVTNQAVRSYITNSFKSTTDPFPDAPGDHLSASAPWDPARIGDGEVTSTTLNVPGTTVGDSVAVGFSQPVPAGALLVGAVTAPNVVTLTLFNKTGRPLDLPSGSGRVDVWRRTP